MKMLFSILSIAPIFLLVSSIAAQTCPSQNQLVTHVSSQELEKDLVETAVAAGKFKTLAAALEAAGLVETLQGKGPFTVFAPTDEAFAKLPKGTVEDLLKPENKEKLISILSYHVVPGKVVAADVVKIKSAKTVQGQSVTVKLEEGSVFIDAAKVIKTDVLCKNGVIHVIDSVILPKPEGESKK